MKDKWDLGTQKVSRYCGTRWKGRGGRRKEERDQRGEAQPMSDMEEVRLYSHALPESGQDSPSSPSLAAETDSQGIARPSLLVICVPTYIPSEMDGMGPMRQVTALGGRFCHKLRWLGLFDSLWTNSGNGDSNGTKNM
jgi:hypothetical protein